MAWQERKDRKKGITECKFSSNGKFLAVGNEEGFIDLYDVLSEYEWIGTCQGHKGPVACIDWSNDSKLLMSDDRLGLHMFWDVESTKEIMVAAEVRDVEWNTFTATQGWSAQGIGPKFQGATGINTSCRSSFGDSMATGDDWGLVKLFRYASVFLQPEVTRTLIVFE
jgi:WD40 repeat protein